MCCLIYHDVDKIGFYLTLLTLAIFVLQIILRAIFIAGEAGMTPKAIKKC
jgi:hypothetical protein